MMEKMLLLAALVGVASLMAARQYADGGCCRAPAADVGATPTPASEAPCGVPKLVDLGRTFCIPCKRMAPILAELKKEYAGRLDVEFIDVGDNRDAARQYGVRLIPTQVFLDASGTELVRHEGFMSRDDILAQWRKLGVELK